jgi:hypothetical protein
MDAHSTSAITEEQFSNHSQSGDMNNPVVQIDFKIIHADDTRQRTAGA